jgi:hypothetical protein
MGRPKRSRGIYQGQGKTLMSGTACDIAISEISGVPLGQLCGFIVLTISHPENHPGAHELRIIPAQENWDWVRHWLQAAVRDIRQDMT